MIDKKPIKFGFTIIQHGPRIRYGLSTNEYCVADIIYHLSNNPDSIALGWCFARRATLGKYLNLSRRTVINAINKLKNEKLVHMDKDTMYLKTTQDWYDHFILYGLHQRDIQD